MPQADESTETNLYADAQKHRERSIQLIRLARSHFPRTVAASTNPNDWTAIGPAFVFRCARMLDAVVTLPIEHATEAAALVRVLYEHVVTFAWIGISPAENVGAWERNALVQAIKAANDAKPFGFELLDAATIARYEGEIQKRKPFPKVPQLAKEADEFWIGKGALSTRTSFRGLYPPIYRNYSVVVHGAVDSIRRTISHGPTSGIKTIGGSEDPSALTAYTAGSLLFAACLLISSKVFSFPDTAELDEIISAD